MLFLILAVISSALVSVTMRLSKAKTDGGVSMLAVNYLMCLLLALLHTGHRALPTPSSGLTLTLVLGLINGLLYLLGFVLLQENVARNGVVLSAAFMKLGLLVPMAVSILFFGEQPTFLQVLGFLLAISAIILTNSGTDGVSGKFRAGLILLLLAGGGGDAMSKIFEELGPAAYEEQFLLFTFISALILCLCLMVRKRERPGKAEALWGLLIGIPNYYSARFLLLSLEEVPAVIAYPTYSVATIAVVSLTGVCLFREKLSRRQWTATGIILAALFLLNI